MTDQLVKAIVDGLEWCESVGVKNGVPMRDKREPGRRRKMEAEQRMSAIIRRMWRRQREKIQQRLELEHPARKKLDQLEINIADDEALAELIMEIILETQDGVSLFDEDMDLTLDYTATNTEAAEWAREYAYDLVKNIDAATSASLQQAVSAFVETPGMTIGDVMSLLPFDAERAMRVAVTEITRAYAHGQQMAGDALKEQYPDVKVMKRWFTNNDDRVCPMCGPLDGNEVEMDENFYEPEDSYQDGNPPRHVNCRCWLNQYTSME